MPAKALHILRRLAPAAAALLLATLVFGSAGSVAKPAVDGRPAGAPAQLGQAVDEVIAASTHDPVAVLDARIEAGEATLTSDGEHGYLPALLDALGIPLSSQGLVFSRTSLQTDRITPWSPRALYFNDDVYVGWVRDSPILEIASIDPDEGAVFYTVAQDGGQRPIFRRETTTCLMCHESRSVTGGVPGVIMRSVLTDRMGYVVGSIQEGSTTDRTPFAERFGGWYVTGTHGEPGHAGNVQSPLLSHEVSDVPRYLRDFDLNAGGDVTDLSDRFDTAPYMSAESDLVALLVFNHQVRVHNVIILARQGTEEALADQAARLQSSGEPAPDSGMLPATADRIEAAVDRLLREMLMWREAPLNGPVAGTTSFAGDFVARGPRDDEGRSLRDLELNRRLFRYPLSFLIYSDAFRALPELVKDRFYRRLDAVLTGSDRTEPFEHLDDDDRRAIREILRATDADFAARTTA